MTFCPKCNRDVTGEEGDCPYCGAQRAEMEGEIEEVKCAKCGEVARVQMEMAGEEIACAACGQPLKVSRVDARAVAERAREAWLGGEGPPRVRPQWQRTVFVMAVLAVFLFVAAVVAIVLTGMMMPSRHGHRKSDPPERREVYENTPPERTQDTGQSVCGWCNGDGRIDQEDKEMAPKTDMPVLGKCPYCDGRGRR